jgi:GrpB-like predicted nucleotidyltransferase (UPF0157 family)
LKFEVLPYQRAWPAVFECQKVKIQQALKPMVVQVEHIGSTAVPGLAAKPIIDILLGARDAKQLDAFIEPMTAAGFTYFKKYEPAMPYRRYFVQLHSSTGKEAPAIVNVDEEFNASGEYKSVVHIHAMEIGTYHWERHIAFRDYLRAHADAQKKYGDWKLHLSTLDFKDGLEYNAAKNSVVKSLETAALLWYKL